MTIDNFFNFPVPLMQYSPDMNVFGDNVMDYCIYKHSLTLNGGNAMKDAAHYFGVTLGNIARSTRDGKEFYDSIPQNSAMTGINKDLLFEFYKEHKTEQEISVLMAFLAIKSILGKKSYSRITTDFLICRMAGYNSKKEFLTVYPEAGSGPEYLQKYYKRRCMDQIKLELQRSYGMKIYGRYTRGFYVSFSLSLEELIKEVEMKRKKYYEKHRKDQQSAAVKKVLAELYTGLNTI